MLWMWGWKEKIASNVIPGSFSLSIMSIGMSPKGSIGSVVVGCMR